MIHSARRVQVGARALDLAIGLGLFLAAWALRAAPTPFVTWDEPAWVYRSVAFLAALQQGHWAGTLLVGHPGVLTMWNGALSLAWHRYITGLVTAEQLQAIASTPWQIHDVALLRQLTALLPLAKGGATLMQAGLLAALYGLLQRLAGRWAALAAALLLLGDPFYLALARVLHLDALSAGWMLAALLALLCYAQESDAFGGPRRRWLILSGVAWGLALLTKTYALLALPAAGLLFWEASWRRRDPAKAKARAALSALGETLREMSLWLLAAALVCLALWPALWVIPGQALRTVVGLSLQYAAQEAEATVTFFRGQVASQVGASFYPFALWFRATPLTLLGAPLAVALAAQPGRRRADSRLALALGGYALLYLALASLSLKKFDRYALPTLLALDALAAMGWVWALQALWRRRPNTAGAVAWALMVLQGVLLLAPLYPAHYLAYYNPLAGGLRQAAHTLPLGWGEGIEEAARFLSAHPQAAERTVATWAVAGLAPLYPGKVLPLTPQNLPQADAVLLYIADWQGQEPPARAFFQDREPSYVATVRGLPYAWVYENDYGQEVLDVLAAQAEPGDMVVANLPTTLQRRDHSAATWLLIDDALDAAHDASDPQALERVLAARLQSALEGLRRRQVFFLSLESEEPRRETLRLLLAERGLLLERTPFTYGALERYRLPTEAAFAALEPSQPLEAVFGDQLALTAFGLASSTVQYRLEAGLVLRWRALQTPAEDYHLSLILLDGAGHLWGQRDLPLKDASGAHSAAWAAGQEALTRVSLAPEAGTPPGDYTLAARIYALADLQPLPVASAQALNSHTLRLATLRVTQAEAPPQPVELPMQQALTATLGAEAELLGYSLDRTTPAAGEELTLTLFWRCPLLRASNEPVLWEWTLERDGRAWQSWQMAPAGEDYPSDRWAADQVLRYPYHLTLSPDLPPGDYALRLAAVGAFSGARLAEAVTVVAALPVAAQARLWQAPPIGYPQPAHLGEEIALLGYDLAVTRLRPGETAALTLYWQALRTPAEDYTVFVHLVDEGSVLRAQQDRQPADGARPTSGWATGEVLADAVALLIPDETPPGRYRLQVGMYHPASGERLPVLLDPDGAAAEDAEQRILLETVLEIEP